MTTVDEMSGGRIEAGVGAGWNDEEHRQLGLDFPDVGERFDLVEDELAILHGLWGEPDGWSYRGRRVSVDDAQFYPKPVQVAGRPIDADRVGAAADRDRRRRASRDPCGWRPATPTSTTSSRPVPRR